MKIFQKKETGFTVVELMIVLTILVILAAVAIPNFLKAREKARDESAKETLKTLKTSLEMYSAENGSYPKSVTSSAELKKALKSEYWPSGISIGVNVGNLSDAGTNSTGTKFSLISVGKDTEHSWQITETGELTTHNGPNL